MKIYVVSRAEMKEMLGFSTEMKEMLNLCKDFLKNNYFISIFSSEMDYGWTLSGMPKLSPLPDRSNVLKLCFDDVTEKDTDPNVVHFNEGHAKRIVDFVKEIEDDGLKDLYVHCDAGVSRSGAVGYLLNEYFNKFLKMNRIDNEAFRMNNPHIMPNPEVMRILKVALFGTSFLSIEVNDYEFNEDGERIDHIMRI